ncbi:MAG: hypothetical protein ACJZ67_03165 [Candidatus Thalassarchaeaceae archaeon]|tara:strand:- start:148 stop:363 length:216 start_codon:yes stop_codon:yes gene_type:complete
MIEVFCLFDIIAFTILAPMWLNKKKVEKEGEGKDEPSQEFEMFDYAFGLFGLLGLIVTLYVIWLFFTTPWV